MKRTAVALALLLTGAASAVLVIVFGAPLLKALSRPSVPVIEAVNYQGKTEFLQMVPDKNSCETFVARDTAQMEAAMESGAKKNAVAPTTRKERPVFYCVPRTDPKLPEQWRTTSATLGRYRGRAVYYFHKPASLHLSSAYALVAPAENSVGRLEIDLIYADRAACESMLAIDKKTASDDREFERDPKNQTLVEKYREQLDEDERLGREACVAERNVKDLVEQHC